MRYYYYIHSLNKSFEDALKEYFEIKKKKDCKNAFFLIDMNYEYLLSENETFKYIFEDIYKKLKKAGLGPLEIGINIKANKNTFSTDELKKIEKAKAYFDKKNIFMCFKDTYHVWNYNRFTKTNEKMKIKFNDIKKLHLSPFEALIYAYLEVTSRTYNKEDKNQSNAVSRSLYGILNTEKIVCMGYQELIHKLINETDGKNVKIYKNFVATTSDNKKIDGLHANIIVYLKDEKYNIDGYYFLDPTWDAGHEFKHIPMFRHFLVPLCDIKKLKQQIRDEKALPLSERLQKSWKENTLQKLFKENSFTKDGFRFSKEFLEDFIKKYPKTFQKMIKEENLSEKELKEKLLNELNTNNIVTRKLLRTSRPISVHSIAYALKNVWSKNNPDLTDDKLYKTIKKIVEWNCKYINNRYEKGAKNAFVYYANSFEKPEDFKF